VAGCCCGGPNEPSLAGVETGWAAAQGRQIQRQSRALAACSYEDANERRRERPCRLEVTEVDSQCKACSISETFCSATSKTGSKETVRRKRFLYLFSLK